MAHPADLSEFVASKRLTRLTGAARARQCNAPTEGVWRHRNIRRPMAQGVIVAHQRGTFAGPNPLASAVSLHSSATCSAVSAFTRRWTFTISLRV